ncbi:MAG: TonB-dependent receptor [Rhodothermaceae bacterium]|nr:TonB-dependent receptor [Rhodothermaceae bacterium]
MFRLSTLLSLLVLAPLVTAQTASITGTVADAASGVSLPGAHVVLEGTGLGAITDLDGRFTLTRIGPGTYVLVASSVGFETAREVVTVAPGAAVTLTLLLGVTAVDVGEVVVTARETLTGLGVLDLPGSAHYIGPEVLDRAAPTDVHRVLREVPGVNLQEEDGYGLRPNVGLRGTGTERSSKITLMEDGVLMAPAPYAAPAAYYFPTIGRMDGVEVRTGSSQIKYGPYTTGGALNLIAAGIPSRFEARADALIGPNGQRTVHARTGGVWTDVQALGGLGVGFVGEVHTDNVDGFKTLQSTGGQLVDDYNTGFDKTDFFGRLRLASPTAARVYQSLTLTASRTDELSNETYLGLTANDFAASPYLRYAGSQVDQMDADHTALRARHVAVFSDRLDLTTTVYRNTFRRNWYKLDKARDGLVDDPTDDGLTDASVSIASVLSDPTTFADELALIRGEGAADGRLYVKANNRSYTSQGVQSVAGLRLGRADAGALLEVGLRVHGDEMDRFQWVDQYAMDAGAMTRTEAGTPGTDSNRLESARAVASFLQTEVRLGRWTVTPGLRYEHITLRREDFGKTDPERTGANLTTRENTVDVLIPGIGLLVHATDDLGIFAGVHRGFAPPDSHPETQPESSVNVEAGLRYGTDVLGVQAVGFWNAYSNLLGSDLAASGGLGSTDQFNGGAVDVKGAELSVTADLAPALDLAAWTLPVRLAYTFTDARFQSAFESEFEGWGTVAEGDALPYLAPHQLAASVGVERGMWTLHLAGSYVAAMRSEAGQGAIPDDQRIDARFVLDASTEFAVTPQVALFGRVHNLLDETYIVARRPAGLRPGLPRTLAVGLRARL